MMIKIKRDEIKSCVACLLLMTGAGSLFAQGKQLTGAYTPAANPALSPAEAQKKFVVP